MVMAGEAAQAGPLACRPPRRACMSARRAISCSCWRCVCVIGCGRGFLRAAGTAGVSEAGGAEKARMTRAFSALPPSRPCREGVRGLRCRKSTDDRGFLSTPSEPPVPPGCPRPAVPKSADGTLSQNYSYVQQGVLQGSNHSRTLRAGLRAPHLPLNFRAPVVSEFCDSVPGRARPF